MVDFSLSALICDADEPKACLPRLHLSNAYPPTLAPPPLVGVIKKKKKFGFQGLTFEVAIVGLWNTDVNSHAKTKGQRSLPVYLLKESQKGDHWRPCLTPEIILQAVTCCEVWTGSWKGGRQVQTADVLTTTRRVQLGRCFDASHRFNCSQKDKRNAAKECSQRLHRKLWFTFLLLTFFTRLVLFYTPPYVLLLKLVKKPR